jgi:uncharacterized RDD family membrane protein YckC
MTNLIRIALACFIASIVSPDAQAGLCCGPARNFSPSILQSLRLGHLFTESFAGHVLLRTESDDSSDWNAIGKDKPQRHHKHGGNDQVAIGQTYKLERGESAGGDVVLIGGTGQIDGTIDGDLVLIGSTASFGGTVNGDLVVNGSNLTITPGAVANGDYVSIASNVKGEQYLTTNGERVLLNVFSPAIPALKELLTNLLELRTMSPTSIASWVLALIALAIRLALGLTFPKVFERTETVVRERTGPSFLIGLAIFLGLPVLSGLLIITVLGILALPFLAVAFFILLMFGTTAVLYALGKRIAPQIVEQKYVACIWIGIGSAVTWVLYCIPIVGFLAAGVISLLGVGAFGIYLAERYRSNTPKPVSPVPAKDAAQTANVLHSVPENLPVAESESVINRARAQFLPRFIANLIDLTILSSLLYPLHLTNATIAFWVLYRFGMYAWKSATLGQIVLNLHVQKVDGTSLVRDYSGAAIRALSSLLSLLPLGLGFIWILFNRDLEAWHDKISGTNVVRRSSSPSRSESL